MPVSTTQPQSLSTGHGESLQRGDNALPVHDVRGVAIINAMVSEEEEGQFTSQESEQNIHTQRDKDKGIILYMFIFVSRKEA